MRAATVAQPTMAQTARSKAASLPVKPQKSRGKTSSARETEIDGRPNPFRMGSSQSVFAAGASATPSERTAPTASEPARRLRVYEKGVRHRATLKELLAADPEDVAFGEFLEKKNAEKALAETSARLSHHFGKDTLQEMIAKKREMFFVQYALGVKRSEINKLELAAQQEEKKLLDDEKALEEDATKFDAFLKENDKNSVEAIKKAEHESKLKQDKIQDIKRLNARMMGVKSELTKNDEQLRDLQQYRHFLEQLTPPVWLSEQRNIHAGDAAAPDAEAGDSDGGADADADLGIYFTDAEQLLDIFAELEENNLALIQSCQETEETLEELKQEMRATEERMEQETRNLTGQIASLNDAIKREEESARAVQERSRGATSLLGAGTLEQDRVLDDLNRKVKEVYRRVIGDNDANLNTLQMLTSIENKLESFFEIIEQMPAHKVEAAEKLKDKERRQRLREEKLEQQRVLQEERIQRALERANAPILKKTGKPVMFRSAPIPKKKTRTEAVSSKEDEDTDWYWS